MGVAGLNQLHMSRCVEESVSASRADIMPEFAVSGIDYDMNVAG